MQASVYLLRFPHGLHIGTQGFGTEGVRPTIPADTLFSAFLSSWVRLGGDPEAWAEHFPRTEGGTFHPADPPFLLTSAFPFAGDVLFFPRPVEWRPSGLDFQEAKAWKKVEYLSEGAFRSLTSGRNDAVGSPNVPIREELFLQGKRLFCMPEELRALRPWLENVWTEEAVPRVTLDRVTSASNLFSVGRVHFHSRCGLWFAVVWRDPERPCDGKPFPWALRLALEELSRQGLGGDRTVGYGSFSFELFDEGVRWPDPQPGKAAVLLSRYHPRGEELPWALKQAHAYRLENVSGWGASSHGQFRRRGLWMLAEGSWIRMGQSGILGELVDVSPLGPAHPGHPVWRYGLGLAYSLEVEA